MGRELYLSRVAVQLCEGLIKQETIVNICQKPGCGPQSGNLELSYTIVIIKTLTVCMLSLLS